jgi:hypothetical protein
MPVNKARIVPTHIIIYNLNIKLLIIKPLWLQTYNFVTATGVELCRMLWRRFVVFTSLFNRSL